MGILNTARHRIRKVAQENTIGNKINPADYDRVISYGCSFTAGDEIADHILLNKTFEETNILKENFFNQVQFYEHYKIKIPNETMYKNAWAGQVAKLLGLPIESRAYPGYSLKQTFFQLYADYKNNKIGPRDLVLVGLTGPTRLVWFEKSKRSLDSAPLHNYIDLKNLSSDGQLSIMNLFDDNILAFDYFSSLNNIQQLKNYMNIRIQPMTVSNTIGTKEFIMKDTLNPEIFRYCLNVWEDARSIILLPKVFLKDKVIDPNITLCKYKHPPLQSHIELAIQIIDRCVTE